MLHVRQADFLDRGAELLQFLDGCHDGVNDLRIEAGAEVLLRQADAQTGERLGVVQPEPVRESKVTRLVSNGAGTAQ